MSQLEYRYTIKEDASVLRSWFLEPGAMRNFPMETSLELTDTINRWMGYIPFRSCLTATWNGRPCGMALYWLNFYSKLRHQALLTIIVDPKLRGKGVGTDLLSTLLHVGKEQLGLTMAHLEVYEGNPAIRLYERLGFKELGVQKLWVKDQEEYIGRILMQKDL